MKKRRKTGGCEAAPIRIIKPRLGSSAKSAFREGTMRLLVVCFGLAILSTASAAAETMNAPVNADDIKWGDAPPVLPKGAQMAVVSGDPSKDGLYVVRLKMPANYRIPAHNHPTTEHVTVLSGSFNLGMGDKFDAEKGVRLQSGGFAEAPAKMNHYGWTKEGAIVQVHGQGPFVITYVDPAEDPSKK
jgi:quercetin dioxygenase-like cupin family protein